MCVRLLCLCWCLGGSSRASTVLEVQKFVTHLGPFESSSHFWCSSRSRRPAFQSNSVVFRHTASGSRVLRWHARISEQQCRMMLVFAIVASLDLPSRSRFEQTLVWRQTAHKPRVLLLPYAFRSNRVARRWSLLVVKSLGLPRCQSNSMG